MVTMVSRATGSRCAPASVQPALFAPSAESDRRRAPLQWVRDLLLTWIDRQRQRFDLAGLDDHRLRDLGLSRGDVEREVRKPFWMG